MPLAGTQYFSVYDTSYLSLIKDFNNKPIFSNSLKLLFQSRNPDGSWGNSHILSDSILSTLSSVYALQQSHLVDHDFVQRAILEGQNFILDNYSKIAQETFFTAGFEFLVPNLLSKSGLDLDSHPITKNLRKYQQKKFSMIPIEYIQANKTPMLFALESLDEFGLQKNLDHFIEPNGSIATSPSTTAWYLTHNTKSDKIPEMISYLSSHYNPQTGSVPSFADYSLMNIPFVLYPLFKADILHPQFQSMLNFVLSKWTPSGVGHSSYFPITDADDTALSLLLLTKYGLICNNDKRFEAINTYKKDNYFVTYPWEIGASNMVNLHVLDMLLETTTRATELDIDIYRLTSYMAKQITTEHGIGGDKYHFSPYCQNAHGVLALTKKFPDLSSKLIDWFLSQQDEDGLWGINGPTVEETAYAVLSLCYYHIHAENIDLSILFKAIDFLLTDTNKYPNLWLSKVAYTPIETVKAHVLTAIELYHKAQ
jgi:prenyltransferase beta subunit